MNKIQEVSEFANKLVGKWFNAAPKGQGTALKNYTSGDGSNVGFEYITESILNKAIEVYGLKKRCEVNGKYFIDCSCGKQRCKCPDKKHDNQRLDNHVWIDGKVVILEENRAWIDKPFYTLKRGVVKCFMELPHTKKHLTDNVIFLFTSLAKDVTPITKSTMDTVMGYGEKIVEINISGRPRRSEKCNYFDNGYDQDELDKYVKTICGVFAKYE
ncbi:hypothetical protein CMI47_06140 [Candidatus Pacearchaeota archaeon]|nr:hypothetical protein [Candidatus Pacearchaeota archaeon]|tara:strand:+ start:66 stop:707 length:642 start_codon:yes stop_codon:yes gene_type:complete